MNEFRGHMPVKAIIFDLGGTLLDWPDWEEGSERNWRTSYDHLKRDKPDQEYPEQNAYVQAMRQAEKNHWQRVVEKQESSTPTMLIQEGFRLLSYPADEQTILIALDGYAQAVIGWANIFPDTVQTLLQLHKQHYRLGLLSNTWWAASWHDADLAAHGLTALFDTVVYTSDLPYSKPHPQAFLTVTQRLGVDPAETVMVGDRMIDDISGCLRVGVRGIWKQNASPYSKPEHIVPTATIQNLSELLPLLESWKLQSGISAQKRCP